MTRWLNESSSVADNEDDEGSPLKGESEFRSPLKGVAQLRSPADETAGNVVEGETVGTSNEKRAELSEYVNAGKKTEKGTYILRESRNPFLGKRKKGETDTLQMVHDTPEMSLMEVDVSKEKITTLLQKDDGCRKERCNWKTLKINNAVTGNRWLSKGRNLPGNLSVEDDPCRERASKGDEGAQLTQEVTNQLKDGNFEKLWSTKPFTSKEVAGKLNSESFFRGPPSFLQYRTMQMRVIMRDKSFKRLHVGQRRGRLLIPLAVISDHDLTVFKYKQGNF
ncbi:hypothetical protein F5879DRAFT_1062746 [Lentinula edodes]|nr:hypothetical protein F5879DRAFT_1062746 [Lentinula edodes]